MMRYGEIWSDSEIWWDMVRFNDIWWELAKFCEIQSDMVRFYKIRWDLVSYDEIQWDLVHLVSFSEIWWALVRFGEILCDMVRSGRIWWDSMRLGEIQWHMVIFGSKHGCRLGVVVNSFQYIPIPFLVGKSNPIPLPSQKSIGILFLSIPISFSQYLFAIHIVTFLDKIVITYYGNFNGTISAWYSHSSLGLI